MLRNRVASILMCVGLVGVGSATAGAESFEKIDRESQPAGNVGPDGAKPLAGVTTADIERIAKSTGLPYSDAEFMLFDGSVIVSDFIEKHSDNPAFGSLSVEIDGRLTFVLRLATERDDMVDELANALNRSVDVKIGGRSAAQLEDDLDGVANALSGKVQFDAHIDADTGRVVVLSADPSVSELLPAEVDFEADARFEAGETQSFAGVGMTTCTATYMVKIGGNYAAATAAHCRDWGQSAYGYGLGLATSEQCGQFDRQLHSLNANAPVWYGFFNYSQQWTNLHAVAGGTYPGQWFFRRGKQSIEEGTVGAWGWRSFNGGDCGNYDVYGFERSTVNGWSGDPGDCGGLTAVVYNGAYYLAGPHTGRIGGTVGVTAWRNIPSGYTACTAVSPCP